MITPLPPGVIPFDPNRFASGNIYQAHPNGTIIRNSSGAPFSYTAQLKGLRDITIIGVNFDDNGLELQGTNNIRFMNCLFSDARRGADNHQAIFGSGNNDLYFDRCRWTNCTQALQLYAGINTTLADCRIEKSTYGYKHGLNGGKNLKILRCVFDQMRATMGCEIQNDGPIDGVLVEDCAYINPELYADDSKNGNSMAFSFPMAIATNVIGRRNYVDGMAWVLDANGNRTGERRASRKGWLGLRIGCEVGGTAPQWYQNWLRNLNDPGAITTSTDAQVNGNRVENCLEAVDPASGSKNPNYQNNGPSVQLPSVGGWSLVGVAAPGTTLPQGNPDPAPTPTPTPTPSPAPAQKITLSVDVDLKTLTGSNLKISGGGSLPGTL